MPPCSVTLRSQRWASISARTMEQQNRILRYISAQRSPGPDLTKAAGPIPRVCMCVFERCDGGKAEIEKKECHLSQRLRDLGSASGYLLFCCPQCVGGLQHTAGARRHHSERRCRAPVKGQITRSAQSGLWREGFRNSAMKRDRNFIRAPSGSIFEAAPPPGKPIGNSLAV